MPTSRKHAYIALIIAMILWGAALPLVKPALSIITPAQFLALRYLSAVIFFIPLLIPTLKDFSPKIPYKIIIITSFISIISLLLLYSGLERTTSIEAALIANTSPILITLAGIIFLKEREEAHEWAGLVISVLGTLLILIAPVFYEKTGLAFQSYLGNALIVLFMILDVIAILIIKQKLSHVPKKVITLISVLISAPIFILIAYLQSGIPSIATLTHPSVLIAVLYMGFFGTAIAFSLVYYGYSKIEASEATLFTYLQPLIYVPLATFWLKEPLVPIQVIGLLLVIVGVAVAEYRPQKGKSLIHPVATDSVYVNKPH
jgi:drug/metabolite transporter (DMT)-like permease